MTGWVVVIGAAIFAQAPVAGALELDSASSSVGYRVVHKLHKVEGRTGAIEAKAALSADGAVLVMARVAVASFKSGDANRDAHAQEVLEVGRFPYVVFKGRTRLPAPEAYPAVADVTVEGELEFHGRRRPLRVPLRLRLQSAQEVRVTGSFVVSLEEYGVERPALLFVKVDDGCQVELDLTLKPPRP